MEAIVLAGGLGTRLRSVLPDLPKPMAPLHGRPFLAKVLDELAAAGFRVAVLAVGYRNDAIREHFGKRHGSLSLRYSVEAEPRGTGGAIRLALEQTATPHVFVLNGDTYLDLNYLAMQEAYLNAKTTLCVAVRSVPNAARYGALVIAEGRILRFVEKGCSGPGVINAGVYLLSRELFDRYTLPTVFSLETDVLMPHLKELRPLAFPTHGTFIDIGVPEDYVRAQALLAPTPGRGRSCPRRD